MDDQAAGVKSLWNRPYVDKERVGIFGTSYGGYASALCLLRYPDVFQAACAQSAVTSWYQYDTIYTERYMWIPQENKEGYEAGSAMTYVKNLKGRLMIYYGTADNNVHPTNAMQLIQALQRRAKSFEVQVGPDLGHTGAQPAADDGVLHRESDPAIIIRGTVYVIPEFDKASSASGTAIPEMVFLFRTR